jgi:hypothetical protein
MEERLGNHLVGEERVENISYQKMRLHIHMSETGKHEDRNCVQEPQFLVIMARNSTIAQLRYEIARVHEAIYQYKCPEILHIKDSQQSVVLESYFVEDAFGDKGHVYAFVRDFSSNDEHSDDKKEHREKTHKKRSLAKLDQRQSLVHEIGSNMEAKQSTKRVGSLLEKKVKKSSKKMNKNETVAKFFGENMISPSSNLGSSEGNQSIICASMPFNGSPSGEWISSASGGIIPNVGYEDLYDCIESHQHDLGY